MKKTLYVLLSLFIGITFFSSHSSAQVLDGVYVKEHVPVRKPIPYTFLREADVMWSKKIQRVVELKEKINHPLYYPTKPIGPRMSLSDLIIYGIKNEGLTAYDGYMDNFSKTITLDEVMSGLGAGLDSNYVYNPEIGDDELVVTEKEARASEIYQYRLKEEWFFDNQKSVMEVRIIGMCGIRQYYDDQAQREMTIPVFWVYFPEYRNLFARSEVFNQKNDAERRTFDDIFWKRHFHSYVVQETNVFDNRDIADYTIGIEAMLEGEKVRDFIFKMEHDLWEF